MNVDATLVIDELTSQIAAQAKMLAVLRVQLRVVTAERDTAIDALELLEAVPKG